MPVTRRTTLLLPLALAAAPAARAQQGAIYGTATYLERIALPPGAVLEVELLDVSRQDAPAIRMAEARIPLEGQVPIAFTLAYDPARIDPAATYVVRAVLRAEGRVLFRSDQAYPVLTRGAGSSVGVLLRRDRSAALPAEGQGLIGPTWIAEDIGGRGVIDRAQSTIAFGTDGRATGRGGCNRFTTRYTLSGAALRINPVASTRMACVPEALADQERRFLAALGVVRAWHLDGAILRLTNETGAAVLRFARSG
jgi:putative lipoprotein